jgi:uncharacterized MAPEG superfamily protein
MNADLGYLVAAAAFSLVVWVPYILARVGAWGLADAVGYPENPPPLPAWAVRCQRAHANHIENLAPMAVLVLAANVAGLSDGLSAWGAALFFWARVVHAVVYSLGIPWLRTISFVVGWVGSLLVFLAIVT